MAGCCFKKGVIIQPREGMQTFILILILIVLVVIVIALNGILKLLSSSGDEWVTSTHYPVFPPEQIRSVWREMAFYSDEALRLCDEDDKLLEKEKNVKRAKDYSNEVKRAVKARMEASVKNEFYRKKLNFMIERNISVLNGKRKIDEVYDEFETKWEVTSICKRIEDKVEKYYKEWESLVFDKEKS